MKLRKIIVLVLILFTSFLSANAQETSDIIRKAVSLQSRGDINGALKLLDKALAQKKDLPEIYKMRSLIRLTLGDMKGAIDDLTEAIKIEPKNLQLYMRRADIKVKIIDETALSDYDYIIANDYKVSDAYDGRARFNLKLGKIDQAVDDYKTALAKDSNSVKSILGLSSIYEEKGKIDEAITLLKEFLVKYELNKPSLKIERTDLLLTGDATVIKDTDKKHGTEQVIVVGNQVISIQDPKTVKENGEKTAKEIEDKLNLSLAYKNLAQLLAGRQNLDEALQNVEKSIALNENNSDSFGIRGEIFLMQKKYQNALKDFDKAIMLNPNQPNYYADRGIAYLFLNEQGKAQKDFDTFIKLNPAGKPFVDKMVESVKQIKNLDNNK